MTFQTPSKQPFLKPLDLNQSDEAILAPIATEAVLPLDEASPNL